MPCLRASSSLLILLAVLAAPGSVAHAADRTAADTTGTTTISYFYHDRGYGSDLVTSPTRLIVNGGLGILQMENRSNKLSDVHWRNGWKNLWRTLGHPIETIEQQGWGDFVTSELLPFSTGQDNAQYWPNYTNHLLGGGMSYRLMREWYRAHGFAHERLWALATVAADHVLNEVVEMDSRTNLRTDPVADMYIFNVAGVLLFESDRVSRFFGHTLNMAAWPFQPLYDPARGTIENQGRNYMIRLGLGEATPWSLFYHWGNSGELGVTRHVGGGHHLSFGAGLVAKNLKDVDGLSDTADLATSFGMFYDRDGSLLGSLLYAKSKDNRWRLNLYPGLVEVGPFRPGFTFISTQTNDFIAGLTFGAAPMLPAGLATRAGNDR